MINVRPDSKYLRSQTNSIPITLVQPPLKKNEVIYKWVTLSEVKSCRAAVLIGLAPAQSRYSGGIYLQLDYETLFCRKYAPIAGYKQGASKNGNVSLLFQILLEKEGRNKDYMSISHYSRYD